jgi:hypothetical protein
MNLNCEAGPEGTNIMDDVRNLNARSASGKPAGCSDFFQSFHVDRERLRKKLECTNGTLAFAFSRFGHLRDDLVEHAQADDNIVDFAIQYPAGAAGFSVHRRYR